MSHKRCPLTHHGRRPCRGWRKRWEQTSLSRGGGEGECRGQKTATHRAFCPKWGLSLGAALALPIASLLGRGFVASGVPSPQVSDVLRCFSCSSQFPRVLNPCGRRRPMASPQPDRHAAKPEQRKHSLGSPRSQLPGAGARRCVSRSPAALRLRAPRYERRRRPTGCGDERPWPTRGPAHRGPLPAPSPDGDALLEPRGARAGSPPRVRARISHIAARGIPIGWWAVWLSALGAGKAQKLRGVDGRSARRPALKARSWTCAPAPSVALGLFSRGREPIWRSARRTRTQLRCKDRGQRHRFRDGRPPLLDLISRFAARADPRTWGRGVNRGPSL